MASRNPFRQTRGWVEVFCGPMFSGKTERILDHANRMRFAKIKTMIVRPAVDTREKANKLTSRDGRTQAAVLFATSYELENHIQKLKQKPRAIYIDEAQFFDHGIIALADSLAKGGTLVVVAGLDTDFRGEPFGPMPGMLAIADKVTKMSAACSVCGGKATKSQRLINHEPASYDDKQVKIGDLETYQPRCREHHVVQKDGKNVGNLPKSGETNL